MIRRGYWIAVGVGIVLSCQSPATVAQTLDAQASALKLIEETADRICVTVPIDVTSSGATLTGDAKASLAGLPGKLVGLGIKGAGKYESAGSKNVLQRDLANAIKDGNNCKLSVFNTLQEKMLPRTQDATSPKQEAISPKWGGSSAKSPGAVLPNASMPPPAKKPSGVARDQIPYTASNKWTQVDKCVDDVKEWLKNKRLEDKNGDGGRSTIGDVFVGEWGGSLILAELLAKRLHPDPRDHPPVYALYALPPHSRDTKFNKEAGRFVAD